MANRLAGSDEFAAINEKWYQSSRSRRNLCWQSASELACRTILPTIPHAILVERSNGKVMSATTEQPRIFISYARSDGTQLAEELVAGLEVAGFRPFLDRQDIAAAEDWESRLGALILGADTVVFILSPAAVKSERCAWEVECATELGKRLIPIQAVPVAEADVPERLRRLNYIEFRTGQSFARPLGELVRSLRQDVAWIREHTRLSEAADIRAC